MTSYIAEILLAFAICGYFIIRVQGRMIQKREKLNNLEYWIFWHLKDYYYDLWYPDFYEKAIEVTRMVSKDAKRLGDLAINDTNS